MHDEIRGQSHFEGWSSQKLCVGAERQRISAIAVPVKSEFFSRQSFA